MKFFVVFALVATVASAAYIKPTPLTAEQAEIQEILAAIHSPSTNPATAAALEQMLLDILGIEPVIVGPAIIDTPVYEPVSVGPAIIDFPVPSEVVPGPAIISPPTPSKPLVQIILNVQANGGGNTVNPVQVIDNRPVVPVQVIDNPPVFPVEVIDNPPVSPVQVVDSPPVSPVQVVDTPPVPVDPVNIGNPVFPSPAIILPEDLN